ncbi:MAG: peptidoglycan recognition protein family protein [Ignavibacteria bacterium]|nr:peptidoglycan recognition protein family protein [Ignavibacteria bacterium]
MLKHFLIISFLIVVMILGCASEKLTLRNLDIIKRSEWNASEPKPYKSHKPNRITIHHEGTFFHQDSSALKHIKNIQTWGMGPERNWVDIPYHFLIDGKGNIIEGRNPLTVGETNTSYDPTGHLLISVIGNYQTQEPRNEQISSIIILCALLCKEYDISPDSIKAHRDYCKPGETSCPGKNLYPFVRDGVIRNEVKKILEAI